MVCKNCGKQISNAAQYCDFCGTKQEDGVREKKSFCEFCGSEIEDGSVYCGNCGAEINKEVRSERSVKHSNNKKTTIIILCAALAVLCAVSIAVFVIYNTYKDSYSDNTDVAEESVTGMLDKVQNKDDSETNKAGGVMSVITPPPSPSPSPSPTQKATGVPSNNEKNDPTGSNDDDKYKDDFTYNQKNIESNPTYTRLNDDKYSYYCAIPDNFIMVTADADSYFYRAENNTAKLFIKAEKNSASQTVESVMQKYIQQIGGTVKYKATGEDWFAVSIERDRVLFYRKCYVDHFVRFFDMEFPFEYLDTYSDCLEYIEDNFKRTD